MFCGGKKRTEDSKLDDKKSPRLSNGGATLKMPDPETIDTPDMIQRARPSKQWLRKHAEVRSTRAVYRSCPPDVGRSQDYVEICASLCWPRANCR